MNTNLTQGEEDEVNVYNQSISKMDTEQMAEATMVSP